MPITSLGSESNLMATFQLLFLAKFQVFEKKINGFLDRLDNWTNSISGATSSNIKVCARQEEPPSTTSLGIYFISAEGSH